MSPLLTGLVDGDSHYESEKHSNDHEHNDGLDVHLVDHPHYLPWAA